MASEPFRCSRFSRELREPLYGTASTATNWILLEQPGPWGWDAPIQSRLPRSVARALRSATRDREIRVALLRRPGRRKTQGTHCFFIHSGPDAPWMERAQLGQAEEILEADLSELAAGRPTGLGALHSEPVFLVCTNGARDPCCAERGRPLAAALQKEFGDRVWESSHIGGDRFAPNLVCFPHGVYFGRVAPSDGPRLAMEVDQGLLSLDHYRGRSCYPFEVQAAEYFARRDFRLHGLDDLRFVRRHDANRGEVEVEFGGPDDSRITVRVAIGLASPPRLLTCKSTTLSQPPSYDLMSEAQPPPAGE